jgi:transketolase
MAAAMNGMALHGGVIPYGGTFFVFSDYCRPSVRLAALMGIRSIFVMTHDSIGVGEDGPTHQPVEQLAAMRAMPRLLVMRPADGVETAECWQIAIENAARPSLLALSRQDTVLARTTHTEENLCAKGAYVLHDDVGAKVTFLSTGTEMSIALKARELLAAEGIGARVVSMPCWDLFEEQPEDYRRKVIGNLPRVAIEAAAPLGWDRYIGPDGAFVGMHSFGASGPAKDVYKHFNITPEAAVLVAKKLLEKN